MTNTWEGFLELKNDETETAPDWCVDYSEEQKIKALVHSIHSKDGIIASQTKLIASYMQGEDELRRLNATLQEETQHAKDQVVLYKGKLGDLETRLWALGERLKESERKRTELERLVWDNTTQLTLPYPIEDYTGGHDH